MSKVQLEQVSCKTTEGADWCRSDGRICNILLPVNQVTTLSMLTSFIQTATQFLQYTTNTFVTKIVHINCQVTHYLCQNKGNGGHH